MSIVSTPSVTPPPSTELELCVGDGSGWDECLPNLAGGSFCLQPAWAPVLKDTLGCEPILVSARSGIGKLEGVLPLYRVQSRLMGDRLFSVPFLNAGGPAGTRAARAALTQWALTTSRDLGVDELELRTLVAPEGIPVSNRKITVVLELPDDVEELWAKGLKAKVRSQIRRPMKEGMVFEAGAHGLDDFYSIFQKNMRDLGTPVLPRAFFEAAIDQFHDQVLLGVVRTEAGVAVAAGLGFLYNGEFEITWASSLREYNRLSPNMLLYWSLMEQCIQRKALRFNFGRCTEGSPTHRFKKQWGGCDMPLPWGRWSRRGEGLGGYESSSTLTHASRLWTRLPLPLANRLGPWLARQLP